MADASATNMADLALLASTNRYEIPSRVNCAIALRLGASNIPGAGRGLFVLQNVKQGALVFEIPNALYSVIAKDCVKTTCDNCFAHKSSQGRTDPRPDLTFTACEACNVAYYCNDGCKRAAWDAYHQFECPNMAAIIAMDPEGVGKANPRSEDIRTIIRILSLKNAEKIPNKDWDELMGLLPKPLKPDGLPSSVEYIGEIMELLSKHNITQLSRDVVEKIIRAYFNNRCFIQLWTPCDLPITGDNRFRTVDVPVGECLEPFYSMINHSCDPNSVWVSKGRTLQIRAEKDIATGEELTVCYIWTEPYQERQMQLESWIGKCSCPLCLNPPREPMGQLRNRVRDLISAKDSTATPTEAWSVSLRAGIRQMQRAGFGNEAWPMKSLHSQLFRCRCGQYDAPNMLKTWLKQYYFVEASMRPQECLANRIRSLTVLAYLLDPNDPTYPNLKPYPEQVLKLAPFLHYQLRARLLHDIRQCHSGDSYCVTHEEEAYEKDFGQLERDAEAKAVKNERDYVPYWASEESKRAFVVDMNELLAWARLPARSESQLLTMHST
ncbi:hypothetical protein IFR05_004195 [Cadophora sp. M221]|nr:hypothetical protein IFR05_004195 [Cadophora sp. M221]